MGAVAEAAAFGGQVRWLLRHGEDAVYQRKPLPHGADRLEGWAHAAQDARQRLPRYRDLGQGAAGHRGDYRYHGRLLLAVAFKKKFVFIETFGRSNEPTVAGRLMHKHADLFFVQWESQKRFYEKARYVGCLY